MNPIKMIIAGLFVLGSASLASARDPKSSIDKGEYLARAGDCVSCHSVPGGRAFAGGLKMGSPVGNIYSTNITPDKATGIGEYTLEDFDRALRRGVARDGHRLYPAMPYPSYAKLTDDDVRALYEFFMKEVPPVHQLNRPNEIPRMLDFRWPLAIWDVLFARSAPYVQNGGHDAAWNRGAYLVQGLGHCGACHTPRGWFFQEKALDDGSPAFLSGADLDEWSAANLHNDKQTGLGQWSREQLVRFLKTGHNENGSAFGSMTDVINNSTPYLTDADISAIALYLKSLPPKETQPGFTYDPNTAAALADGHPGSPGAVVYLGNCVSCHGDDGHGFSPYIPRLADNPTILDKDPASLVNLVLNGSKPLVIRGTPDAYRMPQFRVQLNDQQIADVITFIRSSWGNRAPSVTAKEVADLRHKTDPTSDRVIVLKMR